jgi:hypothetical protein
MARNIIRVEIQILVLIAGAMLTGCARKPAKEIMADPSVIATVPSNELSLHNVRIGDAESAVPESSIKSHMAGYLFCGTHGYKTFGGSIVSLIIIDSDFLSKLNVKSADDLAGRFGPADDALELPTGRTQYTYRAKRIRIHWNRDMRRIEQVEIGQFMVPER